MARVDLPLITDSTQRTRSDSTKDSYIKNMYITKEGDKFILNKRPGIVYFKDIASTYTAGGIFSFKSANYNELYTVYLKWAGTDWYLYSVISDGTAYLHDIVPGFLGDDVNSFVNWSTAGVDPSINNYERVAFSLGVEVFIWEIGNTITQISDGDLISGRAGLVHLDDYLFASDGNLIQHATFEDPFTWPADAILYPQSMVTNGVYRIALHQNHIVAFGANSIEFFYNAGNPTGSILAPRRDMQINNIGLYTRHSATGLSIGSPLPAYVDLDGGQTGAFISSNEQQILGIHLLENFQVTKISNDKIDKYLNFPVNDARYHSISSIKINGKSCVILVIRQYLNSSEYTQSFIYDRELGTWSEWTVNTNIQSTGTFNIISSAALSNAQAAGISLGTAVQMLDGKLYFLSEEQYKDTDSTSTTRDISVQIQTPKFHGGAGEQNLTKYMSELHIIADRGASTNNVQVETTDDDYQTYADHGNLDVSNADNKLSQLGSFRERAFRLTHTANLPLRLEGMEIVAKAGRD